MSQIWYEEVSLSDVVANSTQILLVRAADPPSRTELVPIDQPTWNNEPCPPFTIHIGRFVAIDVLRGPASLSGATVEVEPTDWKSDLESHIEYYVEGLSESPVVFAYAARGNTEGDELILFCRTSGDRLRYAMAHAVEGPELRDEVLALLSGDR